MKKIFAITLFIALFVSCKTSEKNTDPKMEKPMETTENKGIWTKIEAKDLEENAVKLIGDDWMLVSAGTEDKYNTMTASWGGMGYLWNKPVAFIFIRPQRYTYEFIEKSEYFTLTFFEESHRQALQICGSVSGRDVNKVEKTGLHPRFTEMGNPSFEEARIIVECKKIYADMLEKESFLDTEALKKHYPESDLHKMYIGEIVNVWLKK